MIVLVYFLEGVFKATGQEEGNQTEYTVSPGCGDRDENSERSRGLAFSEQNTRERELRAGAVNWRLRAFLSIIN